MRPASATTRAMRLTELETEVRLTELETEVLFGLTEGELTGDTADRLGKPEGVIGLSRWRIRQRLGAHTDAQAVALAYHKGILVPPAR